MPRLKSRQRSIPYGFRFYISETKWTAPDGSFDSVVNNTMAHIQGHPELQAKGWQPDYGFIAERVDAYNAAICKHMGWHDWITEGGGAMPTPFRQAQPTTPVLQDHPLLRAPPIDQNKLAVAAAGVKKIWSGVRTLSEWIDSGDPAVTPELAESRAAACSTCPKNDHGGLESWFTKPAAAAIQKQIERVKDRKLSTIYDDKLSVCNVCYCPLKLKVHTPIVHINAHMGEATRTALLAVQNPSGGCWIPKEVWPNGPP